MEQFSAFKSNPTSVPVLAFNTFAPSHLLHETASSRIRIGTELLETLTAKSDSQNLHHLVTAALVSLRDGLDMMGEIQRRLDAQAAQQS
ncbi:short-chain dehydrogenase [Pseudomonas sp. CFBP13509]|uniref:short-chain dehydrogenase n=1 Tax=Pseudomonas sp. CFBP13509 TaxID=2184008 RepID=UPI0013867B2F|nr:short-chain dehydrogenase [Pseudomonas sp. CFBP13509]